MNKKGLSAVIISLLLVALAIVITGILWAVISNLINEGLGDLTFSGIHTEIKPTRTEYNPETKTWEITLDNKGRERPNVTVTGFKFVFHDERDSWDSVRKTEKLQPGTRKTYYVRKSEMGSKQGIIKEIQIYPIVKEGEKPEKETTPFRITPKKEVAFLPAREFLERLGAIAWWRFENGSSFPDEFRQTTTTTIGQGINLVEGTSGKGKALSDNDTNPSSSINPNTSYIKISGITTKLNKSLSKTDYSVSFFWTPKELSNKSYKEVIEIVPDLVFRIRDRTPNFTNWGYELSIMNNIKIQKQPRRSELKFGEEYHVTLLCKRGEYVKMYVNGIEEKRGNGCEANSGGVEYIKFLNLVSQGTKLDEVVIFNRTLTDWEIENVYRLNYSSIT